MCLLTYLPWTTGDPLEVVHFRCWFRSRCGSRISFSLLLTLGDGHFTRYLHTYHTATLQQPRESLHSLSALVYGVYGV